ncbi:MAG TPA: ABC transporter permease [Terracidiphilus sp.]|jgi:putative ABC transport system permease protein|nr:ABC transporter permease [Terracidiphilus sp.]
MNKLVIANLVRRPMRSIISVLAVTIEVVMILSIVAIFMGMLDDQKQRINGIGADVVVAPSNANFINGMSGAPMSSRLADVLLKMPHIAAASPLISNFNMSGSVEILYGVDYASYAALKPFTFLEGGPFQGPYDVIVDDVYAHGAPGRTVGSRVTILNHQFRICGIVESGKGARRLIPIETMGALTGNDGKASLIYIKADDPANNQTIIREIHATRGLENYKVQTMSDLISLYTPARFPGFDIALNVVISIAVIVGFLVIFQSMYTAVLERTREIGILKSLGSSKLAIVSVVLRETGVLAVAGVLLGIAATYGVRTLLMVKYPTFSFELTAMWIGRGALIAFAGSLFGALYPAWMAARKDPIDALAYE